MFTFIHNYNPRYIEGLTELGMFEKNDGLKIAQHYLTPKEEKFNCIAAKDGALYRLIKEMCGCFYVDRLQGGTFISKYNFDLDLVNEIDRITDGNFLGFQLHESGMTRFMDWNRIQTQLQKFGLEWNLENIIYAVSQVSHNKEFLHFSNGFPEEYAALKPPTTMSEFINDLRGMWANRQKMLNGRILNCDHTPSMCGLEKELNVNISFSEVGAQVGRIRTQLALRRGISRASKKKWGVYLEPWTSTSYLFKRDKSNEWYITPENFPFVASGGNGGSSMSMARRVMYYALFAGANYFAEEWGQANTFYEWDTFELSPYGLLKRDFLKNSRRFHDIKPHVPIAIVIPREYVMFSMADHLPYANDIIAAEHLGLAKKIHAYFEDGKRIGTEDYILTSGAHPSLFDIICDDTYAAPEKEYELLIDFSGRLHGINAVNGNNRDEADAAIRRIIAKLPFVLEDKGCLDYQVFFDKEQTYLALYNHKGVSKSIECGEVVAPEAEVHYKLRLHNGCIPEEILSCSDAYIVEDRTVHGHLSGGELVVFKI